MKRRNSLVKVNVSNEAGGIYFEIQSEICLELVEISLEGVDCLFSDNYFTLMPNQLKKVELINASEFEGMSLGEIQRKVHVQSISAVEQYTGS